MQKHLSTDLPSNIPFPLVVIGAQWGDEGKGKIIDLLADKADSIVRFNGGNNAGHTIVLGQDTYKLSLIPSGVLQQKNLIISQGVVIDLQVLLNELSFFKEKGIPVNLTIDPRVHIVMPYHKALDSATEKWKGGKATGSLKLGIGYCYEDKNNRMGIRLLDMMSPTLFKEKLETILPLKIKQIEKVFDEPCDLTVNTIYSEYSSLLKKIRKEITISDTSRLVQETLPHKKILFEGAHGTFLDGVFGTYPYTTAIHTISGAVFPYVGIAPTAIDTMGIVKCYTTRVGNGPFPTELFDEVGESLQKEGKEVGSVSKRIRRCGWLDLPMIKTAKRLSGFSSLAITKLDVLSNVKEIKVCTNYTKGTRIVDEVPYDMTTDAYKPTYKTFPGWMKPISSVRSYDDLPPEAQTYLSFIEKALETPIKILSVGPERTETIFI